MKCTALPWTYFLHTSANFGKSAIKGHQESPGITRNHQDTFASTFFHARVQSNWTPLAAFIGSGSPFQCGAVPMISMAFTSYRNWGVSMLAVDDPSYDDFNMHFLRLHLNHLPILPRDKYTAKLPNRPKQVWSWIVSLRHLRHQPGRLFGETDWDRWVTHVKSDRARISPCQQWLGRASPSPESRGATTNHCSFFFQHVSNMFN